MNVPIDLLRKPVCATRYVLRNRNTDSVVRTGFRTQGNLLLCTLLQSTLKNAHNSFNKFHFVCAIYHFKGSLYQNLAMDA